MGLLPDCNEVFGTQDLYQVLGLKKEASAADIKKGYRKLSLIHHPDRYDAESSSKSKDEMTRAFQILSKVHFILSDEEKRKAYDHTGIVDDEDVLDEDADWDSYFRALFPKIKKRGKSLLLSNLFVTQLFLDIDSFIEKYQGSEEERQDIKKYYIKFEGDLDKISQYLFTYDEERTRGLIQELIENGEVQAFDSFVNEPSTKKTKRVKTAAKEAKAAKKAATELNDGDDDLVKAIQSRSKGNFDSMIAQLEAKYSNNGKSSGSKSGKKSKR